MKKKHVFSIVAVFLLCFVNQAAWADSNTLFGPQQYTITPDSPDIFSDSFLAEIGTGLLLVTNGSSDGTNTVSSAIITLNGVEVLGAADFRTGFYQLEVPIEVAESNTIEVQIKKAKEGSFLLIEIVKDGGGPGAGDTNSSSPFANRYLGLIPSDATVDYDHERFSIITGLVESNDGTPLSDVTVSVHGKPEYGTATTDSAGTFSIPLNGGGRSTLDYQKDGLISLQRKVSVGWNEIAVAETIRMIPYDTASTTVSFDGRPETIVIHKSTVVSDGSGDRSISMVFTGDNMAYEVDADGNVIGQLSNITTSATEFSTPESMPALLPPNSGYTYCAELKVDGVERVRFDKPVVTWVDNFLGF